MSPRRKKFVPNSADGGNATLKKYGPDFFRKIGKLGAARLNAKYGNAHFKAIGSRGGSVPRLHRRERKKSA